MFKSTCPAPDYFEFLFQGISFWVHSSDLTISPASSRQRMPFKANPSAIDTENKEERYNFSGLVSGEDASLICQALRLAAASPKPHIIMHPEFGALIVDTQSLSINHDYKSETGIAKISIDALEWGELPSCEVNELLRLAELLLIGAKAAFQKRYKPTEAPAWRSKHVLSFANFTRDAIFDSLKLPISKEPAENWHMNANLAWQETGEVVENFDEDSVGAFDHLSDLIESLALPIQLSPVSEYQDALIQSTRIAALAKWGIALDNKEYILRNNACDDSVKFTNAIDAEANAAFARGDLEFYKLILSFRNAALARLSAKIRNLKTLTNYNLTEMHNSISLAHEIYGNGSRFREIEALNPHLTPLLMTGSIIAAVQ